MTRMTRNVPLVFLGLEKDTRYTNALSVLVCSLSSNIIGAYSSLKKRKSQEIDELDARFLLGKMQNHEICHFILPELNLTARLFHSLIVAKEGSSTGLQYLGLSYGPRKSCKLYLFALLHLLWPYLVERFNTEGWRDSRRVSNSLKCETICNESCAEHLKGTRRRQAFMLMRQRMLKSAHLLDSALLRKESDERAQRRYDRKRAIRCLETRVFNKLILVFWSSLKKMYEQSVVRVPTLHLLSANENYDAHGRGMFNSHDIILRDTMRLANLWKWLMRVNSGLYQLNGYYPSVIHRITCLTIDKYDSISTKIIAHLPRYHTVGLLILLDSFSKLTQGATLFFLDRWYESISSKVSNLQNVRHRSRSATPGVFESAVTSMRKRYSEWNSASEEVCCVICMNPRQSSAASTGCGHVFCWCCIHQWIATVRQECPLCRKPCTHQQVISLRNY